MNRNGTWFAWWDRAIPNRRGARNRRNLRLGPDLQEMEERRLLTAAFLVTNVNATGSGSLAAAVSALNSYSNPYVSADEIYFWGNVFSTPQTITLDSPLVLNPKDGSEYGGVIISGTTAGLTLTGAGIGPVLQLENGSASGPLLNVTISNLTFAGGSAGTGAGVWNDTATVFNDCTFSGNSASTGGGLWNEGTATLHGCTFSGNSASTGGALWNEGTAALYDCTLTGNSALTGGGVWNKGMATLRGCTLSGNSASIGGGLLNQGTATLADCTVSANSASYAGGLWNEGKATLTACTISGNSATSVGGMSNASGAPTLTDTIIASNIDGNSAEPSDIGGQGASSVVGSDNLIGTGGSGGIKGGQDGNIVLTNLADSGLSSLGEYGGPTPTIALLPGSPAIGAGSAVSGITTDQRGMPLDSPMPDIGAFQVNPLVVSTTLDNPGSPSGDLSLRQAVNLADVDGSAASISFDSKVFATTQTITLNQGALQLSDTGGTETITGPAVGLTIGGGGADRVFRIGKNVTATLTDLTITGGSTTGNGGGIANLGDLTITDSTIAGNSASGGGGISNTGTLTITDCTIFGDSAKNGGGLWNEGPATITNCTISGNSASTGGGLDNVTGSATLTNTIVAGNTLGSSAASSDIDGQDASTVVGSYDLIGTGGSGGIAGGEDGDIVLTSLGDLGLAPLGEYGGPTPTVALLSGSVAIDAGTVADRPGTSRRITIDQRGMPFDSPAPDIGAFQVNPTVVNTAIDGIGTPAGDFTLRQAVNLADVSNAPTTITFDSNLFSTTQTITLTQGEVELSNIKEPVTIEGPGSGLLTISGKQESRVFLVDDNVTATISGLVITKGLVGSADGGAVLSYGSLNLNQCTVSDSECLGNASRTDLGAGIANFGELSLSDCKISGNSALWFDTVPYYKYSGAGGVYNSGTATLTNCTVTGNVAQRGAFFNTGTATLTGCTISDNNSPYIGGSGFFNLGTATLTDCSVNQNYGGHRSPYDGAIRDGGATGHAMLTIVGSNISGNNRGNAGGAISVDHATVTIVDSTVSQNSGHGVFGISIQSGTATLIGCTITGSFIPAGGSAYGGGAVTVQENSDATIIGCTITGNTDPEGGLYVETDSSVDLIDTIVAGNDNHSGPLDISTDGTAEITASNDLIGVGGSGGIVSGTDGNIVLTSLSNLLLAPLGDYGGPTETMPMLPGSAALGAGVEATDPLTGDPITTDQRGLPLDSPAPDIGAFQSDPLVVNTPIDGIGSPFGDLSLRQAVNLADVVGTAASITFDSKAFATTQTITLTQGQLELADTTGMQTIAGPANGLTISGGGASRVFQVDNKVTATLSGLTISGGLTGGNGGGIADLGDLVITDSTISGNSATTGGGISNRGTLTITDCTIAGDSARNGGGVWNDGQATFTACTISGNTASSDGGMDNVGGTATLTDTIVAGNTEGSSAAPSDIGGQDAGLVVGSYNLIGSGGSGGITGGQDGDIVLTSLANLGLAALGNNGGPTPTMALLPGSQAIGAGIAISDITTDQRGMPLDSPNPDIGAVQLTTLQSLTITAIAPVSPNSRNSIVSSIEVTFSESANTSSLTSGAIVLTDDNSGNLINSGVTLTLVSGSTSTYTIGGLANLTGNQGDYMLTVNAADIQDQYGRAGTGIDSTTWLMDTTAPSSDVVNSLGTDQASDSFPVQVTFNDPAGTGNAPASGVATVELWVSVNDGPFSEVQTINLSSPETSGTVTFAVVGQDRNTYAFHSIALDAAGNVETKSGNTIEASTSVPDLQPPILHVLSSNPRYSWGAYPPSDFSGLTASSYSTGVFTLNWAGVDPDQNTGTPAGSVALANIYVQVDGSSTPTMIEQVFGGSPNGNGVFSGSITYRALADGLSHNYAFFSVGIDDEQKAQAMPATPDAVFDDVTYQAPLSETLQVEKGIPERSFIQYLDVNFNQTVSTNSELQALQTGLSGSSKSSYVELLWYGENLTSSSAPEGSVNLFGSITTAAVSFSGSDLSIDFGASGITSLLTENEVSGKGKPASNFGDGWYALGIDPTGNPGAGQTIWLSFFRLFGSANGDQTVTGPYTSAGTDASLVYHAEGQTGTLLNSDLDGSGAVNSKDFAYSVLSQGDLVGATAPSCFPEFQLLAGGGTAIAAAPLTANAVPLTQSMVQSLVPAAIAAWQAAGLDAADVRKLECAQIVVGNLGTSILGEETDGVIAINRTAAGYNWYVNGSNGSNQAFPLAGPGGESIASPGSGAADDVDLLTVLEHELGHMVGLGDNSEAGDLMDITLGLGIRRAPTRADVAAIDLPTPIVPVVAAAGLTKAGVAPLGAAGAGQEPVSSVRLLEVTQATVDAAVASLTTIAVGSGDDQFGTLTNGSTTKSAGRLSNLVTTIRRKARRHEPAVHHPQRAFSSQFAFRSSIGLRK